MNLDNRILWSSLKVPGATVSVNRAPRSPYTVLKVASLIDTGRAAQTAILENAFPGLIEEDDSLLRLGQNTGRNKMAIPAKVANLNCVFTGRRPRLVGDAYAALQNELSHATLMPIVPEVVSPGDYMIFRHLRNRACFKLAGLLRAVPTMKR
ncbi:MAG: hypothetical protein AAGB03_09515 [Pseudomonadota bacterium]